ASVHLVEALRGRQVLVQVDPKDLLRRLAVRTRDFDDLVEAPRPQEGRVHEVRAVRRADHEDVVELDESVHLAQDLRDDVLVDAGCVHHAADREESLDLVEEDDARLLLVRLTEDLLDDALALPDPLREDVRDADVEEGHVVLRRDRLHEQRLAATRRTGDHGLAVQHADYLRDHALVAHRAAFHDRVRLRVHPDVLADAELRLVDQAGRDLEQFGRARDDNLVPVEVGTFLADDVRVEERRLLDLVELVLVGFQAVLPFLDLVAEGVKVALVLPTEAIHLLLELVSDFFRRLRHLSVALVTRHFWITAGLPTRVVQHATPSALGP